MPTSETSSITDLRDLIYHRPTLLHPYTPQPAPKTESKKRTRGASNRCFPPARAPMPHQQPEAVCQKQAQRCKLMARPAGINLRGRQPDRAAFRRALGSREEGGWSHGPQQLPSALYLQCPLLEGGRRHAEEAGRGVPSPRDLDVEPGVNRCVAPT